MESLQLHPLRRPERRLRARHARHLLLLRLPVERDHWQEHALAVVGKHVSFIRRCKETTCRSGEERARFSLTVSRCYQGRRQHRRQPWHSLQVARTGSAQVRVRELVRGRAKAEDASCFVLSFSFFARPRFVSLYQLGCISTLSMSSLILQPCSLCRKARRIHEKSCDLKTIRSPLLADNRRHLEVHPAPSSDLQ